MFSSPCLRWLCTSIFEDALKYCETSCGRGISVVIISPSLLYLCFLCGSPGCVVPHVETNDLMVLSFQPSEVAVVNYSSQTDVVPFMTVFTSIV